jgi:hypothetical protein
MLRCLLWAIAAAVRPKALLIADNLCLRQQLLVLHRRKPRSRFEDADRRFWVLACRWFVGWRTSVLIVSWRPHRSIGQRAPCAPLPFAPHRRAQAAKIVAIPGLGGLHHVYQHAA